MGGGILRIIANAFAVNGLVDGAAAALEDDAEDAEEGYIVSIAGVVVDAGVVELGTSEVAGVAPRLAI